MHKKRRLTASLLLFVGLSLGVPSVVLAASGYVSGRIMHYTNMGNYCPDYRDCTGATYQEDDYNTYKPIRNAVVQVRDGATDDVLGEGSTDGNGYYTVYWYKSGDAPEGQVKWHPEHKDGRFKIRTSSGGRWVMTSSNFQLNSGTTSSSPQDVGTKYWGNSSSPSALTNLYDGAMRMWESLQNSNRMKSYFTDVEIRAFDDSCPTSCAYGSSKLIKIDSESSAWRPQARVLHEMGHIASHLASRDQNVKTCSDYTYNGDDGWNLRSTEWACAHFEEGIATFFGDRAFYRQISAEPVTCNSTGVCSTYSYGLETSSEAEGDCQDDEARWALTTVRFLWDLYDANEDYSGESYQEPFYAFFDTLNHVPNGRGEQSKNEPWNFWRTSIDDGDGRSARDFRHHFADKYGISSLFTPFYNNCYPAGDW